jgi:hypothetical protein
MAFIGFIIKIINWNMSIHQLPGFDDKQAFMTGFSSMTGASKTVAQKCTTFVFSI